MADDVALTRALELLDGTICECGCLNTEHLGDPPDFCGECDVCPQFQPVSFSVTRADES
jgi:hypothetical protein